MSQSTPQTWSVAQVGQWIASLHGIPNGERETVAEIFRVQAVDGTVLVTLTVDEIIGELQVPNPATASAIVEAIRRLQQQPAAATQPTHQPEQPGTNWFVPQPQSDRRPQPTDEASMPPPAEPPAPFLPLHAKAWSVAQVRQWVASLHGIPSGERETVADTFQSQAVDGAVLVTLTVDEITGDLQVPNPATASAIVEAIRRLQQQPADATQPTHQPEQPGANPQTHIEPVPDASMPPPAPFLPLQIGECVVVNAEAWSMAEVLAWLRGLHELPAGTRETLASLFDEQKIDGRSLVTLTEPDLVELGVEPQAQPVLYAALQTVCPPRCVWLLGAGQLLLDDIKQALARSFGCVPKVERLADPSQIQAEFPASRFAQAAARQGFVDVSGNRVAITAPDSNSQTATLSVPAVVLDLLRSAGNPLFGTLVVIGQTDTGNYCTVQGPEAAVRRFRGEACLVPLGVGSATIPAAIIPIVRESLCGDRRLHVRARSQARNGPTDVVWSPVAFDIASTDDDALRLAQTKLANLKPAQQKISLAEADVPQVSDDAFRDACEELQRHYRAAIVRQRHSIHIIGVYDPSQADDEGYNDVIYARDEILRLLGRVGERVVHVTTRRVKIAKTLLKPLVRFLQKRDPGLSIEYVPRPHTDTPHPNCAAHFAIAGPGAHSAANFVRGAIRYAFWKPTTFPPLDSAQYPKNLVLNAAKTLYNSITEFVEADSAHAGLLSASVELQHDTDVVVYTVFHGGDWEQMWSHPATPVAGSEAVYDAFFASLQQFAAAHTVSEIPFTPSGIERLHKYFVGGKKHSELPKWTTAYFDKDKRSVLLYGPQARKEEAKQKLQEVAREDNVTFELTYPNETVRRLCCRWRYELEACAKAHDAELKFRNPHTATFTCSPELVEAAKAAATRELQRFERELRVQHLPGIPTSCIAELENALPAKDKAKAEVRFLQHGSELVTSCNLRPGYTIEVQCVRFAEATAADVLLAFVDPATGQPVGNWSRLLVSATGPVPLQQPGLIPLPLGCQLAARGVRAVYLAGVAAEADAVAAAIATAVRATVSARFTSIAIPPLGILCPSAAKPTITSLLSMPLELPQQLCVRLTADWATATDIVERLRPPAWMRCEDRNDGRPGRHYLPYAPEENELIERLWLSSAETILCLQDRYAIIFDRQQGHNHVQRNVKMGTQRHIKRVSALPGACAMITGLPHDIDLVLRKLREACELE